ncbi:sister chromatid cohesion protein PDS5 homolog D isoform X2 [Daucus carota subsp. sativus]|uniref:PTM/DIR17-like Tudor domain-containing protein n=1 Tax=Daucus carota subsp. sativus TaxID=79200 RepID=A0A164W4E4_DAUCS|nr:PREDICTED: uncharacterized protein LOC108224280 isoform X2 [Daucus carota subsp. sativus]
MSSCSGLELERELKEAGIRLLGLESLDVATVQDLLNSLDQVDGLLSKVEQAPSRSMQDALYPSMKALISDQLLKHSDIDVKVSVASCMSELTRITAPDAPYDDVQMKEIFRLTVTALGMLSSEASRGYNKALHILETLSKVRACLLMLDLECDQLIADMFNLFLRIIRYIPLPVVFRQMEYIMTLTIEESEEIPEELLSILLTSVTKKKADQSVFSRSWKLGEKVLRNCAVELQHCLPKVIRSRNLNINDFSDVVASICENSPGDELEVATPSAILQSGIDMTEGLRQERTNGIVRGTATLKALDNHHPVKQLNITEAGRHLQPENSDATGTLQAKTVNPPKKRGRKPGSLQKPKVGCQNSMSGERRESYKGPGSQHAHTDGSQPTKLRRNKKFRVLNHCQETAAKTNAKTNHSPGNIVVKKESDDSGEYIEKDSRIPHGINEKLVGRRVKVWWPLDQMFYEGAVASFDSLTQMHKVLYADGDEETLNLSNERWELLEEEHAPAASHKSLKKKAKTKSASLGKPGIISSAKGPRVADKSNTEAPKSGSSVDDFAPEAVRIADVTKDDVSKVDPTLKDDKQKSSSREDVSKANVLRIADMATNSITVNPNTKDDKHKLNSEKEITTQMIIAKPKPHTFVEVGGESIIHTPLTVKDKSPPTKLSEEMVMGILPDTGNAEGSDSGVVKKRRRLVSGEGLTP